ncbi:MAG: hypothetical protein JWM40_342 [Frankiales bacterium]|nr:hypothetical protein [Frankiales bacterium]
MVLALIVLLCAVVVGYLAGGRLHGLGELHLRTRRLVLLALAAQLVGGLAGGAAWGWGLAVSAMAMVGFLVRNRGVMGTGLVALGLAANALVIGLNGAMPVSAEASGRARISTQALLRGTDPRHELADDRTRLRQLGDTIPVVAPWRPDVVSPGDLLVLAGLAELVVAGMLRRRGPVAG